MSLPGSPNAGSIPFFIPSIPTAEGAREIGIFVPVEAVFPGVEASERALVQSLEGLSRDDTLFQCARINILVSGFGSFDNQLRQQQAVSACFTRDQIELIDHFIRQNGSSGPPAVFFRGQLLELMRWVARCCKNLPNDGVTYNEPGVREQFAKAALIASTLWGQRTYKDKLSASKDVSEARLRALGPFRKGVEEANPAPHIGVAIARGLKLFLEYVPRYHLEFPDEFLRSTGISVQNYLACAAIIAIYTLQIGNHDPLFSTDMVNGQTTSQEIFPKFFALESQAPEQLADSLWKKFETVGYKSLRERPIMVTRDGRAMILDPTFFTERISVGALFHILKGRERAQTLAAFSAFGSAFEEYATDILRRAYPSRPGLLDRTAFAVKGSDGQGNAFEIDASLIDVTQAIIFEMKAAFIREEAIISDDTDELLKELRLKYSDSDEKVERAKGVAQLARSVGAIARGKWIGRAGEYREIKTLYPVLVVHDTRLDTPALGHFFDAEFRRLLGSAPMIKHVQPLTVMTIQDLEHLEDSLGSFSFVKLLEDYARDSPDRMRSLHNYMAFSDYATKIVPSRFLVDASEGILDALRAELFRVK